MATRASAFLTLTLDPNNELLHSASDGMVKAAPTLPNFVGRGSCSLRQHNPLGPRITASLRSLQFMDGSMAIPADRL